MFERSKQYSNRSGGRSTTDSTRFYSHLTFSLYQEVIALHVNAWRCALNMHLDGDSYGCRGVNASKLSVLLFLHLHGHCFNQPEASPSTRNSHPGHGLTNQDRRRRYTSQDVFVKHPRVSFGI